MNRQRGRGRRRLVAGALLTVLTTNAFPLPFFGKKHNKTVLCHQCRRPSQGVDAMNSLDATAMAALASLVYVSGWKNRTLPIEIRAYSSKSKHAWRSGWAVERARWAKCAARAARAVDGHRVRVVVLLRVGHQLDRVDRHASVRWYVDGRYELAEAPACG